MDMTMLNFPLFEHKPLFKHVSEMINDFQNIDWRLHGFIEDRSLSMLFGAPSSGKSFLSVDIACCIATGISWHGHKVKKGRVLYIAGEGNRGYQARCLAWSISNGVSLDDAPLSFSTRGISLADPEAIAALDYEISEMKIQTGETPCLIIIDTLARTMVGDENSTRDMATFIKQLDNLKELYDCAILLVHHTGHSDQSRARGSTVLKGALDSEFRVSKDQKGFIRLECTKMKEAEAPESLAFKLSDVQLPFIDENGNTITKAAIESVVYNETMRISSSRLGKNQQLAVDTLGKLISEQRAGLSSQDHCALVNMDTWREQLEIKGLNRQRFNEVKKGLIAAQLIKIDDQGCVDLCLVEYH